MQIIRYFLWESIWFGFVGNGISYIIQVILSFRYMTNSQKTYTTAEARDRLIKFGSAQEAILREKLTKQYATPEKSYAKI
jgi:cell division protein FtsX